MENQKEDARIAEENAVIAAKEMVEKLKGVEVELSLKVGKEGRAFGTVSLKQICEQLLEKYGYDIDKRKFIDKGPLDSFGMYHLKIELFKGVIGVINVHISEEGK